MCAEKDKETEIEITPEMIEAGNDAYFSVGGVFPSVEEHDEAMKAAFLAMLRTSGLLLRINS